MTEETALYSSYEENLPRIRRVNFLLLRILSMINLADMRLLEARASQGTYKSLDTLIKYLQRLYAAKNRTFDILTSHLLRELSQLSGTLKSLD